MNECIFCKIANRRAETYHIYMDDRFMIFHDIRPMNLGHVIVAPRRHIEDISELTDEEYKDFMSLVVITARLLRKILGVKRVTVFSIGAKITHFHFHLVPILNDEKLSEIGSKFSAMKEGADRTKIINLVEEMKKCFSSQWGLIIYGHRICFSRFWWSHNIK